MYRMELKLIPFELCWYSHASVPNVPYGVETLGTSFYKVFYIHGFLMHRVELKDYYAVRPRTAIIGS